MLPKGLVKMKAPDGFGIMQIGNNRTIEADADGSVLALEHEVPILRSHGFKDWHDDGHIKTVDEMSHAELVKECIKRTYEALEKLSGEELRSRLRAATPADSSLPGEDLATLGTSLDLNGVKIEDLDKMHFFQLKAFAKANDIKALPTYKKDELLQLCKQVFDKRAVTAAEEEAAVLEEVAAHEEPEFPFAKD